MKNWEGHSVNRIWLSYMTSVNALSANEVMDEILRLGYEVGPFEFEGVVSRLREKLADDKTMTRPVWDNVRDAIAEVYP